MPANQSSSAHKPLSKPLWWVYFALATFNLSLCYQAFRAFTLYPGWLSGFQMLGMMLLLALTGGILLYDSYIHEKQLGHVANPIRLFDRIEILLNGGHCTQ